MNNKKGISYVKTAAIVLIFSMIISVILSYASFMTVISTTRDNTQRVLDSFCISKAKEIYNSIKQGNNKLSKGIYTELFMTNLSEELGLAKSDNLVYYKGIDREIIYYYANPLTANLKDDTLTLTMDFELVLPVAFADRKLLDLRVPVKVTSAYVLKD